MTINDVAKILTFEPVQNSEMAEVSFSGYGKNDVRLMRVRREGDRYFVTELKVNVELQLATTKDYQRGDNSDVVATDSQKNTVMVLARQNTVRNQ